VENPELDPQMYDQLIFEKAGESIQWKKGSLFSKRCRENWTTTFRKMNLDHFLSLYTKINSKWMKDLNVRQENIKTLEEKTCKNLFDLGHSNFLLHTFPKVREVKAKM
ncbi:LORF2 protein, partial [Crocuta crocuta]